MNFQHITHTHIQLSVQKYLPQPNRDDFYIPATLDYLPRCSLPPPLLAQLMSSDWKGMANVREQKGPVALAFAEVSSSAGHRGLTYPRNIGIGGLQEDQEDSRLGCLGGGGESRAGWKRSWELSLQRLEQRIMIEGCESSSTPSQER